MNILLIDDHIELTNIMQKLLEKIGYTVIAANTCESGAQLLISKKFDIVITNIGLSDCQEHCVIDYLEKTGNIRDTYVVVLSEKLTQNDVSTLKSRGVKACFKKPVKPDLLFSALTSL